MPDLCASSLTNPKPAEEAFFRCDLLRYVATDIQELEVHLAHSKVAKLTVIDSFLTKQIENHLSKTNGKEFSHVELYYEQRTTSPHKAFQIVCSQTTDDLTLRVKHRTLTEDDEDDDEGDDETSESLSKLASFAALTQALLPHFEADPSPWLRKNTYLAFGRGT